MIWAFIIANLKYILLGLFGVVGAYIFKENGRVKEKIKHVEGKNKTLIHQQQFQISQFKRAEEQAKNARDFSIALERKLMEVDPSSLDAVKLDVLSTQPLSFTDISTSPGEPKEPGDDENH